jgi:hypothetical protein
MILHHISLGGNYIVEFARRSVSLLGCPINAVAVFLIGKFIYLFNQCAPEALTAKECFLHINYTLLVANKQQKQAQLIMLKPLFYQSSMYDGEAR